LEKLGTALLALRPLRASFSGRKSSLGFDRPPEKERCMDREDYERRLAACAKALGKDETIHPDNKKLFAAQTTLWELWTLSRSA
jgi:hypothetical protein